MNVEEAAREIFESLVCAVDFESLLQAAADDYGLPLEAMRQRFVRIYGTPVAAQLHRAKSRAFALKQRLNPTGRDLLKNGDVFVMSGEEYVFVVDTYRQMPKPSVRMHVIRLDGCRHEELSEDADPIRFKLARAALWEAWYRMRGLR